MKKNVIILGAMMISSFALAQVGINTPTPNSTLDIVAKNTTPTSIDGLLVPRVDRLRALNMGTGAVTVPVSTLIYVNSIANGSQSGNAVNIDTTGYYYFDETGVWTKLKTPAAGAAADINIYKDDGTLLSNRTVAQADKTLAFTSTATTGNNHFSVDGNTFSVDAVNNRVGIGTTAPAGLLNLVADNAGSGAGNDFYFDGFGTSNYPVFFMGSAAGTAAAPTNLTNGTQIGGLMFKPRVNGGWSYNSAGLSSTYKGNGTTDLTDLRFSTSATTRAIIDENGNMGIGTTTPQNKLHVVATADPIKLEGLQPSDNTTQGSLTTDANGVVKVRNMNTISAVKGDGNFTIPVNNVIYNLNAVSSSSTVRFDNLGELNGQIFTAKQTGMYEVSITAYFLENTTNNYMGVVNAYSGPPGFTPNTSNLICTGDVYTPIFPGGGSYFRHGATATGIAKVLAGDTIMINLYTYRAPDGVTGVYYFNIHRID